MRARARDVTKPATPRARTSETDTATATATATARSTCHTTHHQATRGDITTTGAAASHSANHAPPLECLYLCVVLWPSGVWLCILIRLFARALTRRGKRRIRGRVVAKKIENYEKGALFRVKPSGRGPSLMPTIELVT